MEAVGTVIMGVSIFILFGLLIWLDKRYDKLEAENKRLKKKLRPKRKRNCD